MGRKLEHVYVPPSELQARARGEGAAVKVFRANRGIVAVQGGGRVYKDRMRWAELNDDELGELADVQRRRGHTPPGGVHALWRSLFKDRGGRKGVNETWGPAVAGPWIQELRRGLVRPARYADLRSAYAWSALQGLPDPSSYRLCSNGPWKIAYARVALDDPPGPYPSGMDTGIAWRLVTREEVEAYRARILEVACGITWADERTRYADAFALADHLWGAKVGKMVRRGYWGAWAGRALDCATVRDGEIQKAWQLPPRVRDVIRAHVVQSRVRIRIYQLLKRSRGAARVYVDSVLAEDFLGLTPGTEPGDWGHVRAWEDGVVVQHAGLYTDARTGEVLTG